MKPQNNTRLQLNPDDPELLSYGVRREPGTEYRVPPAKRSMWRSVAGVAALVVVAVALMLAGVYLLGWSLERTAELGAW